MSKIKILAIPSDKFGVGKFRILDPFRYIGDNYSDEIHVDISFNPEDNDDFFKDYNVVVFHSFVVPTTHEANINRIKWLKEKGIKTVMDIDDLWVVDMRHPMYHQIKEHKIAEKKIEMLRLVDYITTTTSLFANTIKEKLGLKNTIIFPNAVNDEESQFQPNPTKSDKIRFGWLGGSSHLHDLELLRNGISSVQYEKPENTQFVLCGFDTRGSVSEFNQETKQVTQRPIKPEETVWYKYEQIFTDNYRVTNSSYETYLKSFTPIPEYKDENETYRRRWTLDVAKYAINYNYFDISLAPLVESYFNANKSQLKVIEAGFHKKALIASNVKPYNLDLISAVDSGQFNNKGNALLVETNRNHKDWAKHMKRLVDNPNMIEDLGNRLYETVKDKFALRNVCKDRVEFFKNITK